MMKVKQLVMGYVETNTYIISNDEACIVIDPCLDPNDNSRRLIEALKGKSVKAILLTHGHFDHISAVDVLVEAFSCPVYMIESGIDWLSKPLKNLSAQMPERVAIQSKVIPIKPGELVVDGFKFDVIMTPGHTNHDTSFIVDDMAFVGDFIMKQTIGRTDLPTGNMSVMQKSIKMFLERYSEIYIYPGHGDITTLEDERKNNPFLKV